jgi:predicted kinase
MKILYLLRGLPGSSKSTLAKQLGGTHFETDNYFLDDNKNYKFDGSKLREAHQWCQDLVSDAMLLNHTTGHNETIVVSNTFTKEWEMKPYMDMAKDWEYMVFSVIVENRHGGVNQHGVPDEKLQKMKDRFEVSL